MLYDFTLVLHIVNACATIAILFGILFVLAKEKDHWYYKCVVLLGLLAAIQTISGVLLVLLNPALSPLSTSLHMALYLGICALAETLLILRIKNTSLAHLLAWARF